MTATAILHLVFFAGLGFAAGVAFFWALARNLALYFEGGRVWPAALHALRLLFLGALLWAIAQAGAGALLSALGGFLAARHLALRGARRAPW
jgi:hypothetical protein